MFKSVFTRYITVFSLIIGASFLILLLIFSAMLRTYSIESKQYLMEKAALNTEEVINFFSDYLADEDFQEAIYRYKDRILATVNENASFAESFVVVTSKHGEVLISSDNYRNSYGKAGLTQDIIDNAVAVNKQFSVIR